MEIENILLFAEVVKHGSFTEAAEHLSVSKGFLSKRIKSLELSLNKKLLIRNTRKMRLTSAGEILFVQSKKINSLWRDTKALLDDNEEELSGVVKCASPVGLGKYLLYPLFEKIMKSNPKISVHLKTDNQLINMNYEDFDFAIRITNTPPEDMIARPLVPVNYICCATAEYSKKFGLPNTPSELNDFDCLVLSHWNIWVFSKKKHIDSIESVEVKGKFITSDNELLKEACLNGLGIARLPDYMIRKELASGKLLHVLTNYQGEKRQIYLLHPQLSSKPKRVQICIEHLSANYLAP
jgi:DNA-binding transcriptional LysR family regulator